MKSSQLVLVLAMVACVAMAHDMTKPHLVKEAVTIFSWGLDLFRLLVIWPIPYVLFILPFGWILAVLGYPDAYAAWVESLTNEAIALTVAI